MYSCIGVLPPKEFPRRYTYNKKKRREHAAWSPLEHAHYSSSRMKHKNPLSIFILRFAIFFFVSTSFSWRRIKGLDVACDSRTLRALRSPKGDTIIERFISYPCHQSGLWFFSHNTICTFLPQWLLHEIGLELCSALPSGGCSFPSTRF